MHSAPAIEVRHTLAPGDLGMVIYLHGVLYAREYGLDTSFEAYVAKPLADFANGGRGRLWIAARGAEVVGSIAIVDSEVGDCSRKRLPTAASAGSSVCSCGASPTLTPPSPSTGVAVSP